MHQSARPDAIRALLLHLLEANAELVGQLLLADSEHHPPHADSAPNVYVNGVRSLDGRHWLSTSTMGSSVAMRAPSAKSSGQLPTLNSNIEYCVAAYLDFGNRSKGEEGVERRRLRPSGAPLNAAFAYRSGGLFAQL